jgi:hypothetical protein
MSSPSIQRIGQPDEQNYGYNCLFVLVQSRGIFRIFFRIFSNNMQALLSVWAIEILWGKKVTNFLFLNKYFKRKLSIYSHKVFLFF